MADIKHVSVPHEFFVKAKNDYADWMFAFFREINQNSGDAGATRIDYVINEIADGCHISVKDNGHGMSLEICESKFLALRQSTKTSGSGSTGAFGVAKEIIAFAHDSYVLESHDYKIIGQGGQYQCLQADEYVKGVRLSITMKNVSSERMMKKLQEWTSLSSFACKVTLNNKVLQKSKTEYPHSFVVEFGQVQFREIKNSSYHSSKLIVKMNDMAMFIREIYTNGGAFEAVLNLNGNSTDRLTANRDSLTGNLEGALSQVLHKLANDRARLTLGEPIIYEFNRKIDFSGNGYEQVSNDNAGLNFAKNDEAKGLDTEEELGSVFENFNRYNRDSNDGLNQFSDNLSKLIMQKERKVFETAQSKISNAIDQIDESAFPNNWIVRVGANDNKSAHTKIKHLNKLKYLRLAYTWQHVVQFVLLNSGLPVKLNNGVISHYGRDIKFGFIIDDAKALCHTSDENILILINPFIDFDLYKEDFETLVSRAVHEVTHMVVDDHGEYYVEVYEDIYVKLRKSIKENYAFKSFSGFKKHINNFIPTYNR